jgi:cytochrome c peroxidase
VFRLPCALSHGGQKRDLARLGNELRRKASIAGLVLAALLGACRGGSDNSAVSSGGASTSAASAPRAASAPALQLSLAAQVGEKIFFDRSLSHSGRMSCATCHSPDYAYGPPNDLAVQLGGPDLTTPGTRAVPSLRYKEFTPPYSDLSPNPDGISPPGPDGGFTWDGRSQTLAAQSSIPLLASNEMDNASPDEVVQKLQAAAYADLFKEAFGVNVFDDKSAAFNDAQNALQRYQREDRDFHLYTSKFDLYRTNKGNYMTAQEIRGLKVFNDPDRGNCIACHLSGNAINGSIAPFTDYSFEAVAPPRNPDIPANSDPAYHDLGLCQASGTGHSPVSTPQYCGMYKTPTLRNVATREVFFHNGSIRTLRDVVEFYNKRDTNPELFYSKAGDGSVDIYDDLPAQFQAAVDMTVPVVHTRGATPAMSEQDVDDLVAFLGTLTDGFQPPAANTKP